MSVDHLNGLRDHVAHLLDHRLPPQAVYHNMTHTLDVLQAAEHLAEAEQIAPDDRLLLFVAVLFHDLGFLEAWENNEAIAVVMARGTLPQFGYGEKQIVRVESLILATRMPQSPVDVLQECICDADLDYLGRDDYMALSAKIRREYEFVSGPISEFAWCGGQIEFLRKHQYFRPASRQWRDAGKARNIQYVENLCEEARPGRPT